MWDRGPVLTGETGLAFTRPVGGGGWGMMERLGTFKLPWEAGYCRDLLPAAEQSDCSPARQAPEGAAGPEVAGCLPWAVIRPPSGDRWPARCSLLTFRMDQAEGAGLPGGPVHCRSCSGAWKGNQVGHILLALLLEELWRGPPWPPGVTGQVHAGGSAPARCWEGGRWLRRVLAYHPGLGEPCGDWILLSKR